MNSFVQTRVVIYMTPDEARAACLDALNVQLALRKSLQEIDGIPISQLVAENVRNKKLSSSPLQLAAPKSKAHNRPKKYKLNSRDKECPHCHKMFSLMGYSKHFASCAIKHTVTEAAISIQDHEIFEEIP